MELTMNVCDSVLAVHVLSPRVGHVSLIYDKNFFLSTLHARKFSSGNGAVNCPFVLQVSSSVSYVRFIVGLHLGHAYESLSNLHEITIL